jgi:hypothetical protein
MREHSTHVCMQLYPQAQFSGDSVLPASLLTYCARTRIQFHFISRLPPSPYQYASQTELSSEVDVKINLIPPSLNQSGSEVRIFPIPLDVTFYSPRLGVHYSTSQSPDFFEQRATQSQTYPIHPGKLLSSRSSWCPVYLSTSVRWVHVHVSVKPSLDSRPIACFLVL